jgi:hypothetical protein
MIWAGVFLLVQRQTGPRASATVDECVTTGAGRYASTHSTGSWIVGGSLLDGGHVVVGTIQGADTGDVGKTIDVTLRGDEAYSRGLALPLMLIGFGLVPVAGLGFGAFMLLRKRRSQLATFRSVGLTPPDAPPHRWAAPAAVAGTAPAAILRPAC